MRNLVPPPSTRPSDASGASLKVRSPSRRLPAPNRLVALSLALLLPAVALPAFAMTTNKGPAPSLARDPAFARTAAVGLGDLGATIAAVDEPAPDPVACTGYPEPRVFLESQAWWRAAGESGIGEHIHAGTCWPLGQTVSGVMRLDIRIILHDQPAGSHVTFLRVGTKSKTTFYQNNDYRLYPDADGNAVDWETVYIDTTKLHDGLSEFRVTANMSDRPDGARMFNSSGWLVDIENGAADSDDRSATFGIEARGYYSGTAYANSRLTSPYPFDGVSGDWTFDVRLDAGSGGVPVTGHMVTVDPDFHHGNAGLVLREGSEPYRGSITLDTRTLADGRHRLVLITHQDYTGDPVAGRNSGVMVIPFTVRNANPLAPPAATPTPTPTATPTPDPTPTETPRGKKQKASTTQKATPAPTPTPAIKAPAAPTATPTPTKAAAPAGSGILISASELAKLPTSGSAWSGLKARADKAVGRIDLSNQDDPNDVTALAKALVYARTGDTKYRADTITMLKSAVGTEYPGDTLGTARGVGSLAIAADLVGFRDPAWAKWLGGLRTWKNPDRDWSLISQHEIRPNNWGTHAGASRIAVSAYLGDTADVARAATVFRGWLGDRSTYAGFKFGDLSWQCDQSKPVPVNPKGCTRNGNSLDGVLPDDQRRGGSYSWPPPKENYVWEALQGATLQAALLERAGYPAWSWSDKALLRATTWLHDVNRFPAEGDDTWIPWLLNRVYGTSFPASSPSRPGKGFGFADWLYAR